MDRSFDIPYLAPVGQNPSGGRSRPVRRVRQLSMALLVAGMVAIPVQILPAQEMDLSGLGSAHPGFRIRGEKLYDGSGYSVSDAGDVNGDGRADIIVGAPWSDPGGRDRAGTSYVVFGKAATIAVDLSDLGNGGFRIEGIDEKDKSGVSVSGAGDVNGDGLADLIVGAHLADHGAVLYTGECYVVFGKVGSEPVMLNALGTGGFRIGGIHRGDGTGHSVSGAGDVNGDGLADLLVGAPDILRYPISAGGCFVVFGKTDTATVELSQLGSGGFRIDGISVGDRAGWSVSGAGDVNGDGHADIVVGAPVADRSGALNAGESYVVFGKADSTAVNLGALGSGGFRMIGNDPFDVSGASVSGAGDVNGDGLADLIVGAPGDYPGGESYVVFGKGDGADVYLGVLGSRGFRVVGLDEYEDSGASVSGAGDVNGDGLADLIVGVPDADANGEHSGRSYVVFGGANSTTVDLGALGDGGFRMDGIDSWDYSGASVSGAGDVNGDGLADLLVGASNADPGGVQRGETYVVFSPAVPHPQPTWRAPAAAGDAPQVAVGITGGGDDSSPSSRCWIDFADGAAASMQTVTLTRDNSGISGGIDPAKTANILWTLSTDRLSWTNANVTFKYTHAEIAGLSEDDLVVFQADAPSGPWTPRATTL
ncbi:FG-GAP repeat protein, partial [Candidatus Poribacteria bacterium]|nr:FG-GAP repeat protein [Candidatus Poribacteria bacterium]